MYLGSRRTTSCLLLGNRTFLNTQRFMLVNGLAIFARERLVLPNEVSIATERQCQQNGGGVVIFKKWRRQCRWETQRN